MVKRRMDNPTISDFAIELFNFHKHKKVWIPESAVKGGNIIDICVMNLTSKPVTVPAKELLACTTEITSQTDRILSNTPRADDVAITNRAGLSQPW